MDKKELSIKLIAELAKLEKKRINVEGILSLNKRTNKRFTSVIAKFIKSTGNTETDSLYFVADESETTTWKCSDLSIKDMKALLAEIEKASKRVYVVTYENCEGFATTTKIEIVTKSHDKAKARLEDLKSFISEAAENYGWECDSDENSIEAYEEGYAAENHKYATLHETVLS